MGKHDEAVCAYLDDNKRFADLFNAGYFAGQEVLHAEDLLPDSERCQKTGERENSVFRDIKKRLKNDAQFIITAVENQEMVDYTMPWRRKNTGRLIRKPQGPSWS